MGKGLEEPSRLIQCLVIFLYVIFKKATNSWFNKLLLLYVKLYLILSVGFVFCHNDQKSIPPLKLDYLWRQTSIVIWWKQSSLYYLFLSIFLVDLKNFVLEVNLKLPFIRTKFYLWGGKSEASLVAQTVKNLPKRQETQINLCGRKILWRRRQQTISIFLTGESHRQRNLVGIEPIKMQRVRHNWSTWAAQTRNTKSGRAYRTWYT